MRESNCGISVPAGRYDLAAEAILKIKSMDIKEREKIGLNGQNHVINHYDYRVLASRFLEAIV